MCTAFHREPLLQQSSSQSHSEVAERRPSAWHTSRGYLLENRVERREEEFDAEESEEVPEAQEDWRETSNQDDDSSTVFLQHCLQSSLIMLLVLYQHLLLFPFCCQHICPNVWQNCQNIWKKLTRYLIIIVTIYE